MTRILLPRIVLQRLLVVWILVIGTESVSLDYAWAFPSQHGRGVCSQAQRLQTASHRTALGNLQLRKGNRPGPRHSRLCVNTFYTGSHAISKRYLCLLRQFTRSTSANQRHYPALLPPDLQLDGLLQG
jgi:hypothetical protein